MIDDPTELEWTGGGVHLRRHRGRVQFRAIPSDGRTRWIAAPLRYLAQRWGVGEGPWPWLLSHGVVRPSPSGKSIPDGQRSTVRVTVHLPPEAAQELDRRARGSSRSAVVAAMLTQGEGEPK